MTEENKLDAYGHLTWTVGNEDWIACFDARRVTDGIEYHVVVDCESGGFTDTIEHGTVPATAEGIANLLCFPSYWADICSEHYIDDDTYGPVEWQETDASWRRHLEFLLTVEPDEDDEDEAVCPHCGSRNTAEVTGGEGERECHDCGREFHEEDHSDEQSLAYFNRYIAGDR